MKLKQGDKVMVVAGKDRGKESRIERVFPAEGKILVEGVNTAKKHMKTNPQQPNSGGIVDRDMPIDASNVMIVCSKCGPTRIGARFDQKGKHRICVKCGGDL
ncbi:MAG: 50S ribosomal protein L24 [Acidimicrobiia bacterium]|nr:50S ribosomal protein L24 [Acidimicrobiia bacterium]MDH5294507.1 50S ribosomal protein L24 [Acidimicrobiia bacterium]